MKVNELREKIKNRKKDELQQLIVEMYKLIPKKMREAKEIDQLIENPDRFKAKKNSTKQSNKHLDFPTVEAEVKTFIKNARSQHYIAPNREVPKKERSNWRFTAKRLVDQVTAMANQPEYEKACAALLEELYKLFCYASGHYVFASDEPFETMKIPQDDFFARVVLLKKKVEAPSKWIRDSLLLIVHEDVDRNTLKSTLFEALLGTLKNAPLKEEAVKIAEELLKEKQISFHKMENPSTTVRFEREDVINDLVEMIFITQSALGEYELATTAFKQHYIRGNKEVELYVLLTWIKAYQRVEDWIKEFESAVKRGVEPRDSLINAYDYIKDKNEFPKYIFSV